MGLWADTGGRILEDAGRSRFAPDTAPWHAYGFRRARHGLTEWLRSLQSTAGGRVVVSAQICPAVRHAVRAAGLTPSFVDVDPAYPTPSAAQVAGALARDVVAVIVAPMYGYVQPDWTALLASVGSTPLCLDMAQGLLLESRLAVLIARSDAALYSFSLGKGVDIGGGVLFVRNPLPGAVSSPARRSVQASALVAGLTWRALRSSGLYRAAVPFIERAIDHDRDDSAPARNDAPTDASPHLAAWAERIAAFAIDVRRARTRARQIGALPAVRRACRDLDVYADDAGATHLRQVLRLHQADRRPSLLAALRALGIDCAPAGEPLPAADDPARAFPNAARFVRDAIRLPFVGRLTDAEEERVEHALQAALA